MHRTVGWMADAQLVSTMNARQNVEAFIVLAPDVVKTAKRLLGKELAGTVIVTEPEPGAAVPAGKLVEMDVKRLDKRGK